MFGNGLVLRRTEDLKEMAELGRKAGLELEGPLKGVVLAFGCYSGSRLVGCASLQSIDDQLFLEYVAVDEAFRNRGIGAAVVRMVEEEARSRGLTEMWAKARLPAFYEHVGYRVYEGTSHGPKSIAECQACPQYHTTCRPALVFKRLRA